MPKVSVIIPCFNQGGYLDEAVNSVLAQTYSDFEIIIVNDGSTDVASNDLLSDYRRPQCRVLLTNNQGLAAARNNGIRAAKGEFILPLDADDRIGPDYLHEAVRILDADPKVGIVYCEAEKFGAQAGRWRLPEFSLRKMLFSNLIFCSAVFRRADWEQVGGYRTNMKSGWEDWDFWLSVLELGREVVKLQQTLFFYRVKEASMIKAMDREVRIAMHHQLIYNHWKLYHAQALPVLRLYHKIMDSSIYRWLKAMNLTRLAANLWVRK
ncbi:glycosyltransferase [Desulfuromonas sp. DDH964]|uniref:glycosyltransferase family 2 protein n=1 Tax=Desulfuromonas sp. DDH964 TaxID=1823759 RepID=UPI00078CE3EA|nr:glycosyltransferase family A protein [Desulfuromonas sp. DDH964]AMV73142.1 glycosyltransferase [Desulfuromonas sp. DDH964]